MKTVAPGDVISVGADVYSATGADRVQIIIDFLDEFDVVIESHEGGIVLGATEAAPERSVIEGVTVPAGTARGRPALQNIDGTELGYATKWMINAGPVALAFADPPIRTEVETAADLNYNDGVAVEDREPAEYAAEQTANKGTAILGHDDASLGQYADWGGVSGLPTTLDGYSISDAQSDLGTSPADEYVLHRDTSGEPYWSSKYGILNVGGWNPLSADTLVPASTYTQMGNALTIPNPGQEVTLKIDLCFLVSLNSGTGGRVVAIPAVSWDGGATWDGTEPAAYPWCATSNVSASCTKVTTGTPTDDIHVALWVREVDTASNYLVELQTSMSVLVLPRSEFSIDVGPVICTIPATASGSCSKAYSNGTTCTASANVTASVTGGVPGYSYSWAKVSGSDSITSGALTKTCTVSGTHTTTDAGASYDTVINCTATDSASAADASDNCTVTLTYYRTYTPVSVSAPNKSFGCIYTSPATACTASGDLERSVSGGDGVYSDSWTKSSGDGSISSGALTATPTVSHTGSTNTSGNFKDTVTDGHGNTGSDTQTTDFNHAQGPSGGTS